MFITNRHMTVSVHREELWKAMINFRIPKKYIDMIKLCNTRTIFKVKFLRQYYDKEILCSRPYLT